MRIQTLQDIVEKWTRRSAAATQDFIKGLMNPRRPWQEATLDAAESYVAGVTASIANKMFEKGVQGSSNAEWVERTRTVGAPRYGPGIQAGQTRYQRGFAPYHSLLASLDLGPRGPRGSAENYARAEKVGRALHDLRLTGA